MVIGLRRFYLIPRAIMRNNSIVATFVEVSADHLVAMGIMLKQKCIGDVKHYGPSAHRFNKSLNLKIIEEIKAISAASAGADANERRADSVHLNVYVVFIRFIGDEEKFKAAIDANGIVRIHSGYLKRPLLGREAHGYTVIGMDKLCLCFIRSRNSLPNAIKKRIVCLLPTSIIYKER